MQQLTAIKAKALIQDLSGLRTIREEWFRQALEIALPILEQQDHEKSIIAGQLEAVRDSLSLTPHQDAVISCAIDRLNVLTLRTLELSRSLIKQQERGEDGWIEWRGINQPVNDSVVVRVKYRSGRQAEDSAACFNWGDSGSIIAYRIISEQPTNQSGEQ